MHSLQKTSVEQPAPDMPTLPRILRVSPLPASPIQKPTLPQPMKPRLTSFVAAHCITRTCSKCKQTIQIHVYSFSIGPNENYDVSMWILTTPPNELHWYGIIKQLYLCNRLPALVRLVQDETEIPARPCYTYEGSASQ